MRRILFTLLLLAACLSASAYDFIVGGLAYYYNSNIGYLGNSVAVTYTTENFNKNYNGGSGSLVIPANVTYNGRTYTVTAIGKNAFNGCSGFTGSLTIPSTVTDIGYHAFHNCSFSQIIVDERNKVLDSRDNCNAIIETKSNTLLYGFKNTIIPNSVTAIGKNAFNGCSGLTGSLTIPSSVTSIGDYAFYECSGLTGSLTIPNSVTSIRDGAFAYCGGFSGSLSIPSSVTSIGNGAFSDCSGFTGSLSIPNSVTDIGSSAFYGCSGFTGSLTIPNSVTDIGSSAFYGCSGFTDTLTIGKKVTSIGSFAFYGCDGFKYVHSLNTSPPTLDYSSFDYHEMLLVPEQSVDLYRFAKNWNEFKIILSDTGVYASTISLNKNNIELDDGTEAILVATIIPDNAENKKVAWKSSNTAIATVDDNGKVTGIGPGTATITATTADGTNLSDSCQVTVKMKAKGISLNKTTLVIGDEHSETLVATVIPNNTSDKSVTWKSSNTAVATVDASGKVTGTGLGTTTITATTADGTNLSASCQVTVIENIDLEYKGLIYHKNNDHKTAYVTYQLLDNDNNYKGLTDVTIPLSVSDKYGTYRVTAIGDNAFSNCSTIKSVKYPSTVTSIGNYAFFNSKIEGFTFSSGITSIGHYAFDNCTLLEQVIIPETVTSIGNNPFARCDNLQSISVSRFNPNYDSRDYCNAIISKADNRLISGCTYTIIPESVTTIGSYAFMGMYNLKSITIPSTVTTLEDHSFKGCSGLTTIVIPANVTLVGSEAFSECMGLTEVFCLGKVPPTTTDNTYVTFAKSTYDRTPLRVRRSCIDAYKNAGSWKGFAHIEGIDGYLYAGNRKFFSGDTFIVPVELINDIEITGVQVDVKMPVGISVAMDSEDYPMVFLTDRKSRTHNPG